MFWIILILYISQLTALRQAPDIRFAPSLPTYVDGKMIEITNTFRQSVGLNELSEDDRLNQSAQAKADDLCKKQYWDHTSPDGTEFWELIDETGYNYSLVGENLAMGYPNEKKAFKALINSPSHYENIVGDYENIGTGWSYCDGDGYIVIHYGKL